MKTMCLAIFAFFSLALLSQEKGVSPIVGSQQPTTGSTRAVIIGISDYADERIPDLRFAHIDAQAFADYLRSHAGGSLEEGNLVLLTNEKATAGKIIAAISWLIAECKANDRAIIYFSGHGDVEQVTMFQRGYLLAYDSPGTTYMAGGSLPVGFLSDVISTLSDAGVEVVMVSDACRSGKLAGSATGGAQATTAALSQQFSKEIKILSCQPEEFSLEGEEWGGGRGCFSYHFIDALTGMADGNSDGTVNLLETGRYLEDKVPAETAPYSQMPMTIGNRNAILSTVQPEALAMLMEQRSSKLKVFSRIDKKSSDEMALAIADTSVQRLYASFTAAVEQGNLMTPLGASANDYYLQLMLKPGIENIKGLVGRNLSAALQDEAQVIINQLLQTDPEVVDDSFSRTPTYDHLPGYLNRAAELLGESHYFWRYVKAREYYFRAKTCRKENNPGLSPDSLLKRQLAMLDTALSFDAEASYVYFQKGALSFWAKRGNPRAYMPDIEKAISLSPEWILPLYYAGRAMGFPVSDFEKAEAYLKKVIEIDSTFFPAYWDLGKVNKGEQSRFWYEEYIRRMADYERLNPDKVPITYYNYLGSTFRFLGRYEEAKDVYLKAIEVSKGQYPFLFNNLGIAYCGLGRYEEAIQAGLKGAEMMPTLGDAWLFVAMYRLFFLKKDLETVPELCHRAIQNGSIHAYSVLNFHYLQQGQVDSAIMIARDLIKVNPSNPHAQLRLGRSLLMVGDTLAAVEAYRKLLHTATDWNSKPAYYYQLVGRLCAGLPPEEAHLSIDAFIESERLKSDELPMFLFWTACAFAHSDRPKPALFWFKKAVQAGWKPGPIIRVEPTLFNPELDKIRHTGQFKKLVRQYKLDQ